jgi:hypothetical protein
METSNIILIIASIIIAYLLFKIIKNIIFKIFLPIIIILGVSYYLYTHYYARNILDDLRIEYCEKYENAQEAASPNCSCFVEIITDHLENKFSKDELAELRKDPDHFNEEFYKAVSSNFDLVQTCYLANGLEMPNYFDFLNK